MLTEDNVTKLISAAGKSNAFFRALEAFPSNLVSDENFKLLADQGEHAEGIEEALVSLYWAKGELVNAEDRELLADQAAHAKGIGEVLAWLYRVNAALVNAENFKLLVNHAEHAGDIVLALSHMNRESTTLVNAENLKLLCLNSKKATEVASVLNVIYKGCLSSSSKQNSLHQRSIFSENSQALPEPLAQKIKKYLCGDRAMSFNQQEKEELKTWSWEAKVKNYIPLASLPDGAPEKNPSQPQRGNK